jgi:ABC-type oligopeptide transport system ATPase subunit
VALSLLGEGYSRNAYCALNLISTFYFFADKIKLWEKKDKTFVKTKNVDSIIQVLQTENCVTVFGKSGMGKSATIHHIALHYQNTYGYTITPCKSPVHIKKVSDKRQIFVIDDICGKYKIRQNELEEWLGLDLLDLDDKIIVSCRSEIFRHSKFQILELFVKHSIELSYCKEDHLEIAAKYLTSENIKQINDVVDISHFIPLLYVLYSRNPNSDLSEFIDSPFKIYTQEWNRLAQLNATQFCVLFLCMLHNGCIDLSSFLSEFQNTESRIKFEYIFDQCGINRGTSSREIITQLDCLRGSCVELKKERYVLIHDTLLDFLCCYFGEKFPEIVIKYADKNIIFERIQLKSISACHEKYIIEISEDFEREYFQRISKEILNGNIIEALDSPQMQYKQYQVKMVHILQQLDKQKLKDLMMITTDDITISEPLFLACSRGYDPIERLIIDKGADINQRNSCGRTPLISASFNGQRDTVLLLIKNGVNIHGCDYDEWTALKYASGKGFKDIVQMLLDNGASTNEYATNYNPALDIAKMLGHKEIMDLLYFNGAEHSLIIEHTSDGRTYYRKP